MRYFSVLLLLSVGLLTCVFACSSTKKSGSEPQHELEGPSKQLPEDAYTIVPDTFVLPPIPRTITAPIERAKYLTMHYWDRFDFTNRKLVGRPEITEQAFVDYINILHHVPQENADEALRHMLGRASEDSVMYVHLGGLFEKYLYDPNSPFQNEELYLPVLNEQIQSPLLTEERLSTLRFQREMALKNRVGQKTTDFSYTLPSGQSHALHDLRSEYTLLMFSNPGCATCASVTKQLSQSEELKRAFSLNSASRTMLTILTVYPDSDLNEWLAHLGDFPATWVNGYDKGMIITQKKLYDIKAIPTLYLLDKEKKVILKDASIEAIESYFSVK